MLLSEQHERLVRMIKESISLMCKSSLTYDLELNVEGLLGITLDKKDIFLVNINESFPSQFQNRTPSSTSKRQKLQQDGTARRRSRNSIDTEPPAPQDDVLFGSQPHVESDAGPHDNSAAVSELYGDPLKEESQLDFANITVKQEVEDDDNAEAGADFGFTPETFGEEGPYSSSLPLAIPTDVSADNGWSSQVHDSDQLATTTTTTTEATSPASGRTQTTAADASAAALLPSYLPCTDCNCSFPGWGPLRLHFQSAHGVFLCRYCNRKFLSRPGRLQHERVHTGATFNCVKCHKIFTTNANLQTHMRAVHDRYKYLCNVCNLGFAQAEDLAEHKKNDHGMSPSSEQDK